MPKRRYDFKVLANDGAIIETLRRRCFRATAPNHAATILEEHPDASAVFAYERRGPAVHAAYRAR